MDYATLRAEHDSLRQQFLAGDLTPAELVAMTVLVRTRAADLSTADRNRLEKDLDALERLARYAPALRPPGTTPSETETDAAAPETAAGASGDAGSGGLVERAAEVSRAARQAGGTAAERRARAEAGIAEIRRLAEAAGSASERRAVLRSTEVLARLASALRDDDPGPAR
jgi:hypothetical protein